MSLHTASPEGEPTPGQSALALHAARVIEHAPGVGMFGQLEGSGLVVHAKPVVLHVPGRLGHTPGLHPSPVSEQVWPRVGQLALAIQATPEPLHVPASVGQLALTVHTRPEVEHAPGMSGH